MTHPNALQKALQRCQATQNDIAYCGDVQQTFNAFTVLVEQRAANAEKFGDEILRMQTELASLPVTDPTYQVKQQKLAQLMAVVSATSTPD